MPLLVCYNTSPAADWEPQMHILRVDQLDQVRKADTVTLPYDVYRRTYGAIQASNKQRHERWMTFAVGKNTRMVAKGKSTPFVIKNQEIGFISDTKPPKRGHALIFHTHPKLTRTHLYTLGFTPDAFFRQTGYPLSPYVTAFNGALNVFTHGDIASFIEDGHKKSYRSVADLLGTSHGYSWMVWSPLLSQFQRPEQALAEYEMKENRLFSRCIKRLQKTDNPREVIGWYRRSFNRLLHSFCKDQGILLFQNDTPADRLLRRVC